MASNLSLILVLLLAFLFVTCGYSLSTRDAVPKQDDESYVITTSDQGSSLIVVGDLAKPRSLQTLVDGSKLIVIKAVSKRISIKSSKKKKQKSNKKQKKKKRKGSKVGAAVGSIIAVVVILCVLYFLYWRHKTKKAQSIELGKIHASAETRSKTEVQV